MARHNFVSKECWPKDRNFDLMHLMIYADATCIEIVTATATVLSVHRLIYIYSMSQHEHYIMIQYIPIQVDLFK